MTILKDSKRQIYWLHESGEARPFAYIERVGRQWWLGGLPAVSGYFATKREALEAAK